ncbi:receptor protein kinase [Artemisia annua]|uniref:non-specific serine/threonine protein kinase n=1 Tax=Artemisia annua TaxID=35608 RepID=A0A2U1QC87_ARTAN|nr:receptor protein kinase [Artemisia annua]
MGLESLLNIWHRRYAFLRDLDKNLHGMSLAFMYGCIFAQASRVMGTSGYVVPEYPNISLLNQKSDVYTFGVLLLEATTEQNHVHYVRPSKEPTTSLSKYSAM